VARSVQGLFRAPGATRVTATVCRRSPERQSPQVDVGDAGAGDGAGSYQALQHFVTDAPWNADTVWRRLRAVLPERRGILILDETSFPKQGPHSVGVARQYCGALDKVANCQVAVTAALWTGRRAWALGALLYVPEAWTADADRRTTARIPASLRFQEKWRLALTLLRQVRAAKLHVTAVVADAEYATTVRCVRRCIVRSCRTR
jgi:SRSO17 transposase